MTKKYSIIKGGDPTLVSQSTTTSMSPSIIFYGIFAGLSMLCLFITWFLSGLPAYGLQATGYGLLFFAMISLGVYIFYSKSLTKYMIYGIAFYMVIIIGAIGIKLYSLIAYKDRIISNATYYSYFNLPIFGLMILQIYLIGNSFIQESSNTPSYVLAFICLLGLITLNASISDYYVLKYFYADGFCSECHK